MKSALIVQGLPWKLTESAFSLPNGVQFERYDTSPVRSLYESICQSQHIDEGEPHSFNFGIIIPPDLHDEMFPYFGGPILSSRKCVILLSFQPEYQWDTLG